MTYQVIARKWRPQTFEEVTGQEAIMQTLRNGIEHDRLHHAYLFSGARGVGKTTSARLLAKALNCHKTSKPNPLPCSPNEETACPSCKEIAESRSLDVMEFDAASNTQVDKIRDLIIENINISPARDRFKVFIIDEVHMLSTSSFNALLKTLEEPPPQVVFIMATTELHKVPETIVSRCQEFEFRTISTVKIFERLKLIAQTEGLKISDEALREIARAGEGSMRDAQSALDQVISFSGEIIEIADVTKALGLADSELLTKTLKAIADKEFKEILTVVDNLVSRGHDLRNFCRDLQAFIRDLLVSKVAIDENLFETALLPPEELKKLSENFNESDLVRFFHSVSETEIKLRDALQPRYLLEIGLIKLVEMQRIKPIQEILERLAKLENLSPTNPAIEEKKTELTEEKKTLTVDFPLSEVPFPVKNPPQVVEKPRDEEKPTSEKVSTQNVSFKKFETAEKVSTQNVSFQKIDIDSLPVKLPPISSEDLEHVEDTWLDSAFLEKLRREGDNLLTIKNASEIIAQALKSSVVLSKTEANGNGSALHEKSSINISAYLPPSYDEEENLDDLPQLPENPTPEELLQYAENHPLIKRVSRIFRAKIVEVKKK